MNDDRQDHADLWHDDEPGVSVRELATTLGRYKVPISLAIAAAALTWILGAVVLLLISPSQRQAELPFRLEFKGAENGEYPNGSKFSPTEILSGPILLKVYEQNDLEQYLPFARFQSALFVLQSNNALEQLMREYRARLADPKLSPVDRERLEAEFAEKRASISKAEHALVFSVPEITPVLPRKLQAKILGDILQEWARQTVQNKGVVLYDLSILSSGIFEAEMLDRYDYVIALDMLRARIQRVLVNVDQLVQIPGAKVVRTTGEDSASLAELRVRLEDMLQFRVQPMLGLVLDEGVSRDPASSIRFLETQLRFNEMERQEAQRRAETVQESLVAYLQQQTASQSSPAQVAPGRESFPATVIPQLSDTFLQQMMNMSSGERDLAYRQQLVDELREHSLEVVPLEAEADYYRQLLGSLRGFEARARAPQPEELQAMRDQIADITSDAVTITNQVNQIYQEISQNLNPSTMLFSSAQPFFTIERSVSVTRILLMGILCLVLVTLLACLGALLHNRIVGKRRLDPAIQDDGQESSARGISVSRI